MKPGERAFEEMTSGVFAQLLRVPLDGFRWEAALEPSILDSQPDEPGPWLVYPAPIGESPPVRQYPPLAEPSLHRRFARKTPTEKEVLKFANSYGMLGHGRARASPSSLSLVLAESYTFWYQEWLKLATLLRIWDLASKGLDQDLGAYFHWARQPTRVIATLISDEGGLLRGPVRRAFAARVAPPIPPDALAHNMLIASEALGDEELLARWKYDDPIEPARYYVHQQVNRGMHGHVHPTVLLYRKGQIFFFPDCLLSAMYVHFALEISGRPRAAKLCERSGCGEYFIPMKRSDQRFCDDRCRKLASYHRLKQSKARVEDHTVDEAV